MAVISITSVILVNLLKLLTIRLHNTYIVARSVMNKILRVNKQFEASENCYYFDTRWQSWIELSISKSQVSIHIG